MNKYICQTPQEHCSGGRKSMNNSWRRGGADKSSKLHNTPEEAFRCYANYLESQGYERLSSREFRQPEGGILVLTKPCRYGGKVRPGKNDVKGTKPNRWMPHSKGKTSRAGLVIA